MPVFDDGTWMCFNCYSVGRTAGGIGGMDGLKAHQDRAECVINRSEPPPKARKAF